MPQDLWHRQQRTLLADLETPVSAYLKLRRFGARYLLESVDRGTELGRYSFIGLAPLLEITCDLSTMSAATRDGRTFSAPVEDDPTRLVECLLQRLRPHHAAEPGDLLGGAIGYLSYEYIRAVEDVPVQTPADGPPLGRFVIPGALLTFDHLTRRMTLRAMEWREVPPADPESGDTLSAIATEALQHAVATRSQRAENLLDEMVQALRGPLSVEPEPAKNSFVPQAQPEPAEYEEWVRTAQEHIRAGDIFQVVLSQRLRGTTSVDPFQVYRSLRMLNPSPYNFFLDFDETVLVGSSPEILVKLDGQEATVRPIAGTRPRGEDLERDRQLAEELRADEKERAEHVMLVDLGRNDLGRVCEYGSVEVTDFMTLERYSHVMHLVSYVRGLLAKGRSCFDLLRATFPAGTVSGAPKVRAMELIQELERSSRGPYAGAVGSFGPRGDMDLCITIRTLVFHRDTLSVQAGAGVVADSDPAAEHAECRRKMEALLEAIRHAERGLP